MRNIRMLGILAVGLTLIVPGFGPVSADGTPDDETPANETVCDVLVGATPGLFGLCVAFCEAQDWGDSECLADGDLADCGPGSSATKILDKYNSRKQDGDPDMPCVVTASACPCANPQAFLDDPNVTFLGDPFWASYPEQFQAGPASPCELATCRHDPGLQIATCLEYPGGGDISQETANVVDRGEFFTCASWHQVRIDGVTNLPGAIFAIIDEETAELCTAELRAYTQAPDGVSDPCPGLE